MGVNTEQSKLMTNSTINISADFSMNGQKLKEVTRLTCSAEVRIRIASAMAALARLNRIWWCNTISFASKLKLYKSLATSISPLRL